MASIQNATPQNIPNTDLPLTSIVTSARIQPQGNKVVYFFSVQLFSDGQQVNWPKPVPMSQEEAQGFNNEMAACNDAGLGSGASCAASPSMLAYLLRTLAFTPAAS